MVPVYGTMRPSRKLNRRFPAGRALSFSHCARIAASGLWLAVDIREAEPVSLGGVRVW
jgi:hypothetical protein